jgi:hypothetical protein
VLESAIRLHALIQRILPRVAEWRMTQIVRETNCLDELFVEPERRCDRPSYLRDFE